MQKKLFDNLIGKQIELFMSPDMPVTSGILKSCDDDFIVIGEEIWSYKAIFGIRPITTMTSSQRIISNQEEDAVFQPAVSEKEQEDKVFSDSLSVPTQSEEAKPKTDDSEEQRKEQPDIVIPDREFKGLLTNYYENRHWGFIESDEVKEAGIPLRDGKRVFFHLNQITDAALRQKLQVEKPAYPDINVVFRLIQKQQGVAADDVREDIRVRIADVVPALNTKPTENDKNSEAQTVQESKPDDLKAVEAENQKTNQAVEEKSEISDELGEIDFYSRYGNPPHGKIRIKGNKLFSFQDIDVIDPVLAVFLEVSPSAEGQAVKFTKYADSKGRMRAENIEAATPFPDDKLKSWADLIEKAKKRMQQEQG